MPAQSLASWQAAVGGATYTGNSGYLAIFTPNTAGSSSSSGTGNTEVDIDISKWVLYQTFEEVPISCSGMLGATDSRRIGYSYRFEITLVFDARFPPDVNLRKLEGVELYLWFGDLSPMVAASSGSGTTPEDKFYWIPIAKLDTVVPVLDAEKKRMMRALITGHAASHVFLIPDMGTIEDGTTIAGAYDKYLDEAL